MYEQTKTIKKKERKKERNQYEKFNRINMAQ